MNVGSFSDGLQFYKVVSRLFFGKRPYVYCCSQLAFVGCATKRCLPSSLSEIPYFLFHLLCFRELFYPPGALIETESASLWA